jgi:signal transduction histidine kinase
VRIWVEDNGVGIAPESHQKIFGIFERATDQATEGTGIGLAIVARAMQRMHGSCGVTSTVGQGSRFWLVFHVPPAAAAVSPGTRAEMP